MELVGKKIAFLGDSITEGHGVAEPANRFADRLKADEGLAEAFNYGIGGTRIAHQPKASEKPRYDLCFCGRAYDIDKSVDVIVVFGGTNDFGHGLAPLGEESDKTPDSFFGALEFLMSYLKSEYPKAQLVFMTPARRIGDTDTTRNMGTRGKPHVLLDFVDAIIKKAKEHGIPVLDMYRDFEIDPNVEEMRVAYTTDGLHFNDAGHEKIAAKLAEFLHSL